MLCGNGLDSAHGPRACLVLLFIEMALLDDLSAAHGKHRDLTVWNSSATMGDQHVGKNRKVIAGDERAVDAQVLDAVGCEPSQASGPHSLYPAANLIVAVRQRVRLDADYIVGPVLFACGEKFAGQPQCRKVGGNVGRGGRRFAHRSGRASRPNSLATTAARR